MYETPEEIEALLRPMFHYRFVRILGSGAFGLAVLVYDEVEREEKVLKLPKDRQTTEALKKEGDYLKELRRLQDPNIIQLYQFGYVLLDWHGAQGERYYLNMAYGGASLRDLLGPLRQRFDSEGRAMICGSGKSLGVERAVQIAMDVASGLRAAHSFQGPSGKLVHRDIKPENILVDEKTQRARIADFGIARILERSSAAQSIAGTPIYMAPEALDGDSSIKSDLYSLGVVLFEMITGDLPYHGVRERRHETAPRISSLFPESPPLLDEIVAKLLAIAIEDRFSDAAEALEQLRLLDARLNPFERRYTRIELQSDGRWLCRDSETGAHVCIRVVQSAVSLEKFTSPSARDSAPIDACQWPQRAYRRAEYVGVVSDLPQGQGLRELFGAPPVKSMDDVPRLCEAFASTYDLLDQVHRRGHVHGFLSEHTLVFRAGRPALLEMGLAPLLDEAASDVLLGDNLRSAKKYMCAEQLAESDSATPGWDVYALAGVLWTTLTDQEPHPESNDGVSRTTSCIEDARRFNNLIPDRLVRILTSLLKQRPAAAEAASMLRQLRWPEDLVETWVDEALSMFPPGAPPIAMLTATDILDRAQQFDPGNPLVHWGRGMIYFRYESYKYAIEEFMKAARVHPNAEVFVCLGDAHGMWDGNYREAAEWYRRALAFGEHPAILRHLAECLRKLGRDEPANEYARRAEGLTASGMGFDSPLPSTTRSWRGSERPAQA